MVYCRYANHSPASGRRGCRHRRYLLRRRLWPSRAPEAPRGGRKAEPWSGPSFLQPFLRRREGRPLIWKRRQGRRLCLVIFRHGRSLNCSVWPKKACEPAKLKLALILCFCATTKKTLRYGKTQTLVAFSSAGIFGQTALKSLEEPGRAWAGARGASFVQHKSNAKQER